jgi:hypothetical protein
MNRTIRNFRLDLFLYVLLGMNIILINLNRRGHFGFGWHIHGAIGTLLTLGCLIHIALHWRCFHAVLTGKAKGKGKFMMHSLITLMLVLASISGHEAGGFHHVAGTIALIGLSAHGIRNSRWMILTAKRLSGGQRPLEQASSSD